MSLSPVSRFLHVFLERGPGRAINRWWVRVFCGFVSIHGNFSVDSLFLWEIYK